MHGLVVIEGMTLSGHPWIINEIGEFLVHMYKAFRTHLRIRDLNLHNN